VFNNVIPPLHGACPERDVILRYAQNNNERRVQGQNDNWMLLITLYEFLAVKSGTGSLGFCSVGSLTKEHGRFSLRSLIVFKTASLLSNWIAKAGSTPLGQASEQAPAK